jgi:hypothetical protein
MWNVAVVRPLSKAQSTVLRKTSGPSSSSPKTKLPLTMMPRSSRRRTAAVVPVEVLGLVALPEVGRAQGLEPDEEAAQPRLRGALDEIPA